MGKNNHAKGKRKNRAFGLGIAAGTDHAAKIRRALHPAVAMLILLIILPAIALAQSDIVKSSVIVLNGTGVQVVGGNLDINNYKILNVAPGAAATDAATKLYADTQAGKRVNVTLPANNITAGTFRSGSYGFTIGTGNTFTVNGTALVVSGTTNYVGLGSASPSHQLELATHTTPAGGIGFGTDVELYRGAANVLYLASGDSLNVTQALLIAGTTILDDLSSANIVPADGSASAPAFSFSSDTDTGLYRVAADTLSFVTAGVNRVVLAAGLVGINITTPSQTLTVQGDLNITGNLRIGLNCTGCPGDVPVGAIVLYNVTLPVGYTSLNYSIKVRNESWNTYANMTTTGHTFAAGTVNNVVYAIRSGSSPTFAYDPALDSWSAKANKPVNLTDFGSGVGVVGDVIYVIGGCDGGCAVSGSSNIAYTTTNDSWSKKTNMTSSTRYRLSVIAVGDTVYALGGTQASTAVALATVEAYNTTSGSWSTKTDMPYTQRLMAAAAVNNTIYTFGGQSSNFSGTSYTKITQAYDTTTNTWSIKSDMTFNRSLHVAAAFDDVIYVIGGEIAANTETSGNVAYTPANDSWSVKANMTTPRSRLAGSVSGSVIYLIGGQLNVGTTLTLSTNEGYSPEVTYGYAQKY